MYKVCKNCAGIYMANNDRTTCAKCNGDLELIKTTMPLNDTFILPDISNDFNFIKAMMELHDADPIEYQLKLSQFKSQLNQQESSRADTRPKCPHCHSTNIKSISGLERAGSIAMWGLFSKKINKSFKCNHCGYTW